MADPAGGRILWADGCECDCNGNGACVFDSNQRRTGTSLFAVVGCFFDKLCCPLDDLSRKYRNLLKVKNHLG